MLVEAVWTALKDGAWMPIRTLKDISGLDDEALMRVVNFLARWRFVEVEKFPEFRVKRRVGVISPVTAFRLLRGAVKNDSGNKLLSGRKRLAERVACRICQGRRFKLTERNEVECLNCIVA
jgi:hypothetical protein